MDNSITAHDQLEHWRCPSLGGPVTFKHCRRVNNLLPCARMPVCWENIIDTFAFLKVNYTSEELEKAFGAPSKSKLETVLGALEQAKRPIE